MESVGNDEIVFTEIRDNTIIRFRIRNKITVLKTCGSQVSKCFIHLPLISIRMIPGIVNDQEFGGNKGRLTGDLKLRVVIVRILRMTGFSIVASALRLLGKAEIRRVLISYKLDWSRNGR